MTTVEENNDASTGTGLVYDGRSVRSWVEMLNDTEDATSQSASESLVRMSSELVAALPALAPALHRRSGASRAQAASALGLLGVQFLGVITRFRAALRTIVLTDRDEDVRTNALHALRLLGPTCSSQVPALVEALRDELPDTRAAAAQDLAQLGGEARESIPALISACTYDPDLAVRVQAAAALWRVGKRLLPALPTLVEGLHHGEVLSCWTAADCLGDMGAAAAEAVPALIEAYSKQQFPLIKMSITMALERIDPKAAAALS